MLRASITSGCTICGVKIANDGSGRAQPLIDSFGDFRNLRAVSKLGLIMFLSICNRITSLLVGIAYSGQSLKKSIKTLLKHGCCMKSLSDSVSCEQLSTFNQRLSSTDCAILLPPFMLFQSQRVSRFCYLITFFNGACQGFF